MSMIPPDPGVGGGAQYLAQALAARPEVDREVVYRKIEQLARTRPGFVRYKDGVMLDIARRLWKGLSWAEVEEQLPAE
jgi:hypothetical protein